MKLDQLRRMALFAMVVKEGSFTAVSKQQNIATSAVSSAISQLENEIGARLLHRTTRQLRLTEAGAVFLKRCDAMLFEAHAAHDELHQSYGELAGTLTIAVAHLEADTWLLPALKPLLYQHPKLIPHLVVGDGYINLVEHGIDIAIRSGELTDSSLVARALTSQALSDVLVATPEYVQRHGLPSVPSDLSQHYIVAFSSFKQAQTIKLTHQNGALHNIQLKLGAKTDTLYTTKQLCLMNLGIARLPYDFVQSEIMSGQLIQLLPSYSMPTYKIYAVTAQRSLQPAKVSAAIQALQDYFALKARL
ncbi:MAG: LysR family transcriptional regulator [Formosimonas sp.]